MTRKHFEKLAACIRLETTGLSREQRWTLVHKVGDICLEANPRFDRERFAVACMFEPTVPAKFRTRTGRFAGGSLKPHVDYVDRFEES